MYYAPRRYAILGDVHANLVALEAVLADCHEQGVTNYACVGDLVGYNAQPIPCLDRLRELCGPNIVRGNHDHVCSNDDPLIGFHPLASAVVKWTRSQLDPERVAFLSSLPYTKTVETFMMVHATLDTPESWGYIFDKLEAEVSFSYQMSPVCFFGHSHVPLAFEKAGIIRGGLYHQLVIAPGRKYLINVGSVGQPRDSDPRAAYAIYDLASHTVELRRVPYDVAAAQKLIREAGLPERAAARLAVGR